MLHPAIFTFIEKYGFWSVIFIMTIIFYISLLAFYFAKPEKEVSFFRVIRFTKNDNNKMITKIAISSVIYVIIVAFFSCVIMYYTNKPIECPYNITAADGTIRSLIDAESQAVNTNSISIIKDIYSSNAVIKDSLSGKQWNDPVEYYDTLFKEYEYNGAINYDINQIEFDKLKAIYTSASKGRYKNKTLNKTSEYDNKPGSNEWRFSINNDGCWEISSFTFNIKQ
jgi:hypothetical protein